MNEETVNKFTVGATVLGVNMFWEQGDLTTVHVLLDNGAILVVHGAIRTAYVLGPSGEPEKEP